MWAKDALAHEELLANQIGSASEFMTMAALVIIACVCYAILVVARQRKRLAARGIFMPSGNKAVDQMLADGILDVIQNLFLKDKITGKQYKRLVSDYGRAFKLADLKPRKRKLGDGACAWLKAQIKVRRGTHTRMPLPDGPYTHPGAGAVNKGTRRTGRFKTN